MPPIIHTSTLNLLVNFAKLLWRTIIKCQKPYPMLECQVQVFHLHLSLILWPPSLPPSPFPSLSPFLVYGHSHVVATKCVAMPWVKWTYCLCRNTLLPSACLLMGSLVILVMNSVALGKVLAPRRFVRAICEVLETINSRWFAMPTGHSCKERAYGNVCLFRLHAI